MDRKTILVTGAAKRLGAQSPAKCTPPAPTSCCTIGQASEAAAAALVSELNSARPSSAACAQADLLDVETLPRLVAAVARFGRLDALVNNASSFFPTPLGDDRPGGVGRPDRQQSEGAALSDPGRRTASAGARGAVVNITDIHAERPLAGYPLYCAAKPGCSV
jgi:pteridine reductase